MLLYYFTKYILHDNFRIITEQKAINYNIIIKDKIKKIGRNKLKFYFAKTNYIILLYDYKNNIIYYYYSGFKKIFFDNKNNLIMIDKYTSSNYSKIQYKNEQKYKILDYLGYNYYKVIIKSFNNKKYYYDLNHNLNEIDYGIDFMHFFNIKINYKNYFIYYNKIDRNEKFYIRKKFYNYKLFIFGEVR